MANTVSIVLRTKNRPFLLKRAVFSVMRQRYERWNLIVVNDGGKPDDIESILEPIPTRLRTKITLIHHPSSIGMEKASNIALKQAQGEFIAIHDDDDSWHPEFLERCIHHFTHVPYVTQGVVTHTDKVVERIVGGDVIELYREPFNSWLNAISLYQMAGKNLFPPISFVYRRKVLADIGSYCEELPVLGDWEFNLRFLRSHEIDVIPLRLAFYHHRLFAEKNYESSVLSMTALHQRYDTYIRNKLLREDLQHSRLGLGWMVNMAHGSLEQLWKPAAKQVSSHFKEELFSILGNKKSLAIFGAGLNGRSWAHWIASQMKQITDICFIDNNPEKNGQIIDHLPVFSISILHENNIDSILIASSGYHEILEQLKPFGFQLHDNVLVG